MGLLSRRGFLQTLAASAVGAATFDPKSLLWVPAQPATVLPIELIGSSTAQAIIDTQLELNDLAMQCARAMTDRLWRTKAVALRQVMFRHSGHIKLGALDVEDVGIGHFTPNRHRVVATGQVGQSTSAFVNGRTGELYGQMFYRGGTIDMFAPIGAELRAGEPFTPDVGIGLATDPESGLSVRVVRYQQPRGGRGLTMALTDVEMAGGTWHPWRPKLTNDRLSEPVKRIVMS